jgi:hypothetical protein
MGNADLNLLQFVTGFLSARFPSDFILEVTLREWRGTLLGAISAMRSPISSLHPQQRHECIADSAEITTDNRPSIGDASALFIEVVT